MSRPKLNDLIGKKTEEISNLQRLYRETKSQIDNAVEQGNNALLDLQTEFDDLAARKRELLRDVEKLEDKLSGLEKKIHYAENTYGNYLSQIREGKKNES